MGNTHWIGKGEYMESAVANDAAFREGRFLSKWVLLTVVGLLVGFPAAFLAAEALGEGLFAYDSLFNRLNLGNATLFVVLTAVVSLIQWLALRRLFQRMGMWVPAAAVGFGTSFVIYGAIAHALGIPGDLGVPAGAIGCVASILAGGALAGILQSRMLRGQVAGYQWWIPASAAGWGLSMVVIGLSAALLNADGHTSRWLALIGLLAALGLAGAALGLVTGGTIVRMMRRIVR
jgi:hypothetical protein